MDQQSSLLSINKYLCIVMAENARNPTPVGFSEVPTKTQLNTNYPQSDNLNPTLTKLVFFIKDCRVGALLTLT
jgi:hypothetical protein